jgi:hypothetical protein
MISTIFQYGSEVIEVRILNNSCLFRTANTQGGFFPIEAIKLDKEGCIREHPDLKDNKDWKEETIKRFKQKLKDYDTDKQRMKYIISDLTKHGYKPLYFQETGYRPIKIK